MLLKNKVVLITGATTGIGAASARCCVEAGAKVMIHGRNKEHAQALCKELQGAADYVIGDLLDPKTYPLIIKAALEKFGALHCLVNNAGIYPRSNIDTVDAAHFDEVMTVNAKAPLFVAKEAVNAFRRQKTGGVILNIGSMNAHCGQPDLLAYSMSKGALMTMTRNLADALGPEKIRVNCLNVGWTPTEAEIELRKKEGLPDNWQERIPKVYAPFGRLQSPAEVAHHVVFWISDFSAPTTGAVYEVETYPIIGRNRLSDVKIT